LQPPPRSIDAMHSIVPAAGRLGIGVAFVALSLVAVAGPSAQQRKPRQKPVPLLVKLEDHGFRWSDAGIGAAAGFGAALVLAGSLALTGRGERVVIRSRHHREEQP
jgi:hypothetical protein